MAYPDFLTFMREVVLLRQAANPDHVRLDGAQTGGNREAVGRFLHRGREWVVHADTYYEPLMLALSIAAEGADPFIEEDTPRGLCLSLTAELRARQQSPHKYLYIYSWPETRS